MSSLFTALLNDIEIRLAVIASRRHLCGKEHTFALAAGHCRCGAAVRFIPFSEFISRSDPGGSSPRTPSRS
jgi:hypothetical protein